MGGINIDLDGATDRFVFVEAIIFDKLEILLEFGKLRVVDQNINIFGFETVGIKIDCPATQKGKVAERAEIFELDLALLRN